MFRVNMTKFTTTNFIGKGDVVGGQSDPPSSDEVIQGGDYVTKTLKIPVDISCLYEANGDLTAMGKELQKYIGFKRINDKETSFYGTEIELWRGPREPIYNSTDAVKKFEFKFNNNDVKKIIFEVEIDENNDNHAKTKINVKFLGRKIELLNEITVCSKIKVYRRL